MTTPGKPGQPGAAVDDPGALTGGPSPRLLLGLGLLSLAVLIAVMTLFKMSNNDIWIHLKTGEYVLENGWVPQKDPYSFIAADRDYVAHEWLSGVLFHIVYAAGGVQALIFFKAAILAASCALLYMTARLLGSRISVILPVFACVLYISTARFLERPHIFSYLFGALYLFLFFRYRECGRDRRWLYLILPAHTLWTNLHGGYVQGLAMLFVFALGEQMIGLRARFRGIEEDRVAPARDIALLWLLIPGCLAASLVNPYGYRLLTFPFELTGMDVFMNSIYEWQPPFHASYNRSTMFFFYLVQIGWLGVTFFLSQRDRTRARGGGESLIVPNSILTLILALIVLFLLVNTLQGHPAGGAERLRESETLRTLLYGIFALFVLHALINIRSVDITQAGLIMLFLLMSLRHNRAVTDAAMGLLAILAASGSAILVRRPQPASPKALRKGRKGKGGPPAADPRAPVESRAGWRDRSTPAAVVVGSFLVLGISLHASWYSYYFDFRGSARQKGFGIATNMPVCAVDYIERKKITGNAFVAYPFAAMLIHRMHPEVKVNMDSRNDVYGEKLYREYYSSLRTPQAMESYLSRRPIDFFMLSYGERVPATFNWLQETGEWAPVYYDSRAFILLRKTPETEALIRDEEFRFLKPAAVGTTQITQGNAMAVLLEAERAVENCPTSPFGHFYKSKALTTMNRLEDAVAAAEEIIRIDPRNHQAYAEMGYLYFRLKRVDAAVRMYEKALSIAPGYEVARRNLNQLRRQMGGP